MRGSSAIAWRMLWPFVQSTWMRICIASWVEGEAASPRASASGEALARALASLAGFLLAIARRRVDLQGGDEPLRGLRHLVDGALERGLVRARGTRRPAQLAHELQRRGADLVVGGRRLEVRQRLDVTAHGPVS